MSIAALIFSAALMQAADAGQTEQTRFQHCVAMIDNGAEHAYEEGMAWAAETHEIGGYRCAALALIAEQRYEEGARRLESLASIAPPEHSGLRAELLSQAGNAWLLDRDPAHARSAFTRAIVMLQATPDQLPDLLIDRARAYAMEADYRHAEEDLSHALDTRPRDALALRLRSAARMHQNAFDLALADAQAAVDIEPRNVDSLVALGNAREARRTGHPVDTQ